MLSTVRAPAVAGRFYPLEPAILANEVRNHLSQPQETAPAIGCVAPHAGYMYSGHVAGAVFSRVQVPHRCLILCPNHTGKGTPLSIMSRGKWQTPLGIVPVDSELGEALKSSFPPLTEDSEAHRSEHGVEVELPFLQALQPNLTFVPIALGTGQFEVLESLGKAIAEVVATQPDKVLLIASSDMNHYEPDAITRVKDSKAIEKILNLDARGLFDVVHKERISMCGFGPTVSMLTAARLLGATSGDLVRYATSGDVSGDRQMVVGYAGVIVR